MQYDTIIDIWEEYVSRCGEFEPALTLEELRDLWHEHEMQYHTWYQGTDDALHPALEAFWSAAFK